MEKTSKTADVLIVEDNPGDVRLIQESLKAIGFLCHLHVMKDGVEAMSFLKREDPYGAVARPDLVLLDLNLPKKNGRDVLAEIKANPSLRTIPVVVLSSSNFHNDIEDAYARYANCFVSKPGDFDSYRRVVQSIFQFWLNVTTLPQGE